MYEYKATRFVCIYIFVDLYSDAGSSHKCQYEVWKSVQGVFCMSYHIKYQIILIIHSTVFKQYAESNMIFN